MRAWLQAVHPYACDDVYIGHVNVSAPRDEGIPNDDGIDPDSTSNVRPRGSGSGSALEGRS